MGKDLYAIQWSSIVYLIALGSHSELLFQEFNFQFLLKLLNQKIDLKLKNINHYYSMNQKILKCLMRFLIKRDGEKQEVSF